MGIERIKTQPKLRMNQGPDQTQWPPAGDKEGIKTHLKLMMNQGLRVRQACKKTLLFFKTNIYFFFMSL